MCESKLCYYYLSMGDILQFRSLISLNSFLKLFSLFTFFSILNNCLVLLGVVNVELKSRIIEQSLFFVRGVEKSVVQAFRSDSISQFFKSILKPGPYIGVYEYALFLSALILPSKLLSSNAG